MPLAQQTIPVLLAGGLETKADARNPAIAGKLVRLENARMDAPGRLRKRWGYERLGTAPAGSLLAAHRDHLLVGTGSDACSLTASGLVSRGVLESIGLSTQALRRDAYQQTTPDLAVHPLGITVATWETSASGVGAQYAVYDSASGQPITAAVKLGTTASKPKPLVLGHYVVVIFYEGSTNALRYIAIPAAAPSSPTAAADLATDPHTDKVFDACVVDGERLFVTYLNNAGANKVTLRYLSAQLVLSSAVTPTTAEAYSGAVAIFPDADRNVWVGYYSGSAVKVAVWDYALASQVLTWTTLDAAPGTVRNVTGVVQDGTATVLYEASAAQTYNHLVRVGKVTLAGAVSGVGVLLRSVGLASKAFVAAGRPHVLVAHESSLQPTYFLAAIATSAHVVAKVAPGIGGGLTERSILPEASALEGRVSIAHLRADQIGAQSGVIFSQSGVEAVTFAFDALPSAAELSDDLHISGGILAQCDGAQVVEHGFHLFPENLSASVSGVGLTGQYQYVAVWEWMDALGLLHRSAPSVPLTVNPVNQGYQLTIPTLRLTSKAGVSVVVYRTEANGVVFYRLTSIASPLLNSTTADTVTYTDNAADSAIIGNEQLYTTGGELENIAAPAPAFVTTYRNRAAVISAENPRRLVLSKEVIAGTPVEFTDGIEVVVDAAGGGLTGAVEMDDKLILFKKDRVRVLVGAGPAPNGLGSDYGGGPVSIPSECGCTNPRSIVLTPAGVMFQSAKGIYLLGRDLSFNYVGADVEQWNGETVTSAKLIPNTREVRFTLASGTVLVFDYFAKQWMTDTRIAAVDSAIYGGRFAYLTAGGKVMRETPGSHTDDGEPVLMALRTSWLSFAGISGLQRVWKFVLRGDYRSPHRLRVSVATDDNPAAAQNASVDVATVLAPGAVHGTGSFGEESPAGGAFPAFVWRVPLLKQKTSSVQVTIEEAQVGPEYGEGLALVALTFLAGVIGGVSRASKARTVS